jgi:hypothetical protein
MRLLYFSPVPAGSYAQRPHFMVRAWLEWGVDSVLWVNPHPCRLPQWRDVTRNRGLYDQGTSLDARVRVLDVPSLPIEPLPMGPWLNRRLMSRSVWHELERFASGGPMVLGIGRPSALALDAFRELSPVASFFDAMDDFPEFHRGLSRRAMRRHEDAIALAVSLVVASSTHLANKFAHRGLRVEKLLNACEKDAGDEKQTTRKEEASLARGSFFAPRPPVFGYVGCLGHWFDWPLVIRLAEAMPQAQVELVGPCAVAPPSNLPANIRMLPPCKQSATAGHLARFSVGLIPFRSNGLTAGVDPIKYYEYRAAGLPVLSTRFGEMALRGREDGVYFLDHADNLAATATAALEHCDDAARIDRFRCDNNWRSRFRRTTFLRSLLADTLLRRAA